MNGTVTAIKKADAIKTGFQAVTPPMAEKWLEGNTHNRKLYQSVVNRYAADMKAGKWRKTHQGIAFDEDGTLIDGQHRLFAIWESGVTVTLMVTWGLPLDSQMAIDDGLKRSVVDVMKISGTAEGMNQMTSLHAAVARRMRSGLNQRERGADPTTRQDQGAFLTKHWEALNFIVGLFPVKKRIAGINAAPLAAMCRAYYYEDGALLQRFAQILHSGLTQKAGDECVIVLRNWLIMRKPRGGGDATQVEAYAKTLRTLVAFAKGETIRNGRLYGVTEDPYPLPVKNAPRVK